MDARSRVLLLCSAAVRGTTRWSCPRVVYWKLKPRPGGRAGHERSRFYVMACTNALADFEDVLEYACWVGLDAGVGDAKDGDAELCEVTGSLLVALALGFVD